jgi:serine phosphatase RsbU (regulator of sigma subunit)
VLEQPARNLDLLERENMQLRRAVDELSILNELSAAIGASRDVQEVIQTIIRRSLKAVRAEQGVITLVGEEATDPTRTLVRTMASSGETEAYSPDQNLLGWMHLHKRPLVINDPRGDDRFRGVRWPESVRSIVSVPMIAQSRLIGILTLYNKKRDDAGFSGEDQRLLAILAAQSAQIVENARLYQEERKLLEMQQQVRLAFDIQSSLLPSEAPTLPGYELAAITLPAAEVGGDYFDYIRMDDGRLAISVGDVSGKGMPAALLMANVQATLRGQTVNGDGPATSLGNSNRLLCQSTRRGSFVTLFLGFLDAAGHEVRYANAGHNRPYLVRGDGTVDMLALGGLVAGFMPDHVYGEESRSLSPGDMLVVFSDGVTEAFNEGHEQYGEERLIETIRELRGRPARQVVDGIVDRVKTFAGAHPQSDDITLLVVRRTD